MDWNRSSRDDVKAFVERMNSDSEFYDENIYCILNPEPADEYADIHDRLKLKYSECKTKAKNGMYTDFRSIEYGIDLEMGKEVVRVLHDFDFSPRDASDDEIWLYFNRYVVPDIILDRFRKTQTERKPKLVPDRFYENSRRFYLKMLWWYYYISWQDSGESWEKSLDKTFEMLKSNMSNDISQLIERAGDGYSIPVDKEILVQYSALTRVGIGSDRLLSKVLKLNIVYMQTIEPELIPSGIEGYVRGLFEKVCNSDE